MPQDRSQPTDRPPLGFKSIPLVRCRSTWITFGEQTFELTRRGIEICVALDADNHVTIRHKNQQVPYKAVVLGGVVLQEEIRGSIDYAKFFTIHWEDDLHVPVLDFVRPPARIVRDYVMGQRIELGIEEVSSYHVVYHDGVTAEFEHTERGFDFAFSTGLHGSFWEEPDESYVIRFKGDRLQSGEDDFHSQSKFIISRSKYTGKPLLILQEDATVELR